jgi:hypothetical protein
MTMAEQTLSRKAFAQEQKINTLRDQIDAVAPGESAHVGPAPADDFVPAPPSEGPDYASIPRSGPRDLPEAGLKKVIEKQDALIKALKARLNELEKKKS